MKFGEKVRNLRKKNKMSQGELAVAIGVSLRTVQNYEKSGMHPKQRDLYYRLAEVLNVDVNYLLTEDEEIIFDAYKKGGTGSMRDVEGLIEGCMRIVCRRKFAEGGYGRCYEGYFGRIFFR